MKSELKSEQTCVIRLYYLSATALIRICQFNDVYKRQPSICSTWLWHWLLCLLPFLIILIMRIVFQLSHLDIWQPALLGFDHFIILLFSTTNCISWYSIIWDKVLINLLSKICANSWSNATITAVISTVLASKKDSSVMSSFSTLFGAMVVYGNLHIYYANSCYVFLVKERKF